MPNGRKRKGQMRILVSDPSQIGSAEIFGKVHYPGNKIPGHKVILSEDPEKDRRKIGALKSLIFDPNS